jgi:flagellar basal-body rod protein FlgB
MTPPCLCSIVELMPLERCTMIDQIEASLAFHQRALALREERQKVLASNIANADTPGYKARDLDFSRALQDVMRDTPQSGLALNRTSDRHLMGQGAVGALDNRHLLYRVPDQPSLDGNTVDMDRERSAFADNSVRYQAALTILDQRLQGLRQAMQLER